MRLISASSTSTSAPSRPATRAWLSSGCWFTCDLHNRSFHSFGRGIRRASCRSTASGSLRTFGKIPASRRHPQFSQGNAGRQPCRQRNRLSPFPGSRGIAETENRIRQHGAPERPSFEGTRITCKRRHFHSALLDLLRFGELCATALMCAEAVWWSCHRKLLSDILLVRDVQVRHILSAAAAKPHQLSEFARETSGRGHLSGSVVASRCQATGRESHQVCLSALTVLNLRNFRPSRNQIPIALV